MWAKSERKKQIFVDGKKRIIMLNLGLYGWKIAEFSCKFPSVRTENSELLLHLISIPMDGKQYIYAFKFPSVWMENSEI